MRVVIGQPGGYGDLFFCAPIAKHYADAGYEVFWPVGDEHFSIVEKFPYVTPIRLPDFTFVEHDDPREVKMISKVIMGMQLAEQMEAEFLNLADRPIPSSMPEDTGETPEEKKYRISEVPWEKKYTLEWTRDIEKENELFDLVTESKDYIFCHLDQSDGTTCALPDSTDNRNIVKCVPIDGYNILDWYRVIIEASEIYCIESCIQCLVDGLGDTIKSEKYLLSTKGSETMTNSPAWNKKFIPTTKGES
jgi:hypothetical protein